jgi:hypothetical protein
MDVYHVCGAVYYYKGQFTVVNGMCTYMSVMQYNLG